MLLWSDRCPSSPGSTTSTSLGAASVLASKMLWLSGYGDENSSVITFPGIACVCVSDRQLIAPWARAIVFFTVENPIGSCEDEGVELLIP